MMEEDLPPGWVWATLKDLGPIISGGTPKTTDQTNFDGDIPWITPADLTGYFGKTISRGRRNISAKGLKTSSARMLPSRSVVFSSRAPIGYVAIAANELATNQGFKSIAVSEEIDESFVYFYLKSAKRLAEENASGTTFKEISGSRFAGLPIPVPPLNEQRRIVEKIETLFARLDKGEESLRAAQKLLAHYRQSVLKAAVTGELTADWRAKNAHRLEHGRDLLDRILKTRRENRAGRGQYTEPVAPNTVDLPELPEGWVWGSVDQLLAHLTSGSRDWKQYYGRGEGVFIMAQNVRPMRFDLSEVFAVDPPPDGPDAIRSEVQKDDILITIVGANTGDVCRFPLDEQKHYVCQSVALLRMVDLKVSPFVELILSGKGAGRDQLEKFIYGAGRPHLSFEQLRSVCVPLPSLEEQALIMDRVSEAFEKIRAVEHICLSELTRSKGLRQSVLKDAFSGRLVDQDPSDEPAGELLARIKSQQPLASKTKSDQRKTRT